MPGMVLATIFVSLPLVVRELVPVLGRSATTRSRRRSTLGARVADLRRVTLPAIRWALAYGIVLTPPAHRRVRRGQRSCRADRGKTQTLTLYVQQGFQNFDPVGGGSAAFVLAVIAMVPHLDQYDQARRSALMGIAAGRLEAVRRVRRRSMTSRSRSRAATSRRFSGRVAAGKSTLLRIIAGLEKPDTGTVEIDGARRNVVAAARRRIGFVFQHYAAFKHMTVFKNVAFGLEIRKRPKAEVDARVNELLELVAREVRGPLPSELSGGQRQRMALARALAVQPRCCSSTSRSARSMPGAQELRVWLRRLPTRSMSPRCSSRTTRRRPRRWSRIAMMNVAVGRSARPTSSTSTRRRLVMGFLGPITRLGVHLPRPHRHPHLAARGTRSRGRGAGGARWCISGSRSGRS